MGALTTCPHCGHPADTQKSSEFLIQPSTLSAFRASDATLHSTCDAESTLLFHEINGIEDAIRHLYEERAARCRRLNEIQSLAATLPSHILCNIFQHVCPPTEYNSAHQRVRRDNAKPLVLPIFALSAVSSRWRQIILSMPHFWSKMDWHWKYHLSADDTSALLRTYFMRSNPLPFDLKLTIDEKWEIENTIPYNNPDHVDGHLNALKETIFFENGGRIGSLKLDAPIRWLHLLSSKSFIYLSDLSLRSGKIDDCIDLSPLPSLTQVTFMNIKITPILPWKRISTINLICAHINVALDLLKRCPNLTEFHSQHPNPVKNVSIIQTLKDSITLSHLKWLDWSCIGSLWDDALFRFMHFPFLQRLSLTGDISFNIDWEETLTKFLTCLRSSSTPGLTLLELGYVRDCNGAPLPVLRTVFNALGPSLQNLTILEDDHTFLDKVLTLLTPSPSSSSSSSSSSSLPSPTSPSTSPCTTHIHLHPPPTIYLPSLLSLSIQSPDRHEHTTTKDHNSIFTRLRSAPQQLPGIVHGDLFIEFLKQRRKILKLERFCLDLNFVVSWREGGKEEVRRLVCEEGFEELALVEGGRKVEWLEAVRR
ncbi:hypothetical protein AN958_09714 [Leucoagaricus sp. SymC.cos]|nr:hypothetical protein AN958_09714 [Leucoagaricus sp. SymC.cos]